MGRKQIVGQRLPSLETPECPDPAAEHSQFCFQSQRGLAIRGNGQYQSAITSGGGGDQQAGLAPCNRLNSEAGGHRAVKLVATAERFWCLQRRPTWIRAIGMVDG